MELCQNASLGSGEMKQIFFADNPSIGLGNSIKKNAAVIFLTFASFLRDNAMFILIIKINITVYLFVYFDCLFCNVYFDYFD